LAAREFKVAGASASRQTVAIVDDDPRLRQALAEILEFEGYAVVACATGASLIAHAAREPPPSAVILDLMLRDTSGGRCLHALRESPWASVPVLIFSGWGHLERLGLDAQGFVSKTADPISLVRAVDRLVHISEQARSPPAPAPRAPRGYARGSRASDAGRVK
jgi:DNA-binding response OmpR family regulator